MDGTEQPREIPQEEAAPQPPEGNEKIRLAIIFVIGIIIGVIVGKLGAAFAAANTNVVGIG